MLPIQRCLHDCYWSSDDTLILYGGQTNGVPALGDLWTYDPATSAWQEGPQQAAAPRQLYSLAAPDGVGIVFGGGSEDGGYLDDTWLINHRIPELAEQPVPDSTAGAVGGNLDPGRRRTVPPLRRPQRRWRAGGHVGAERLLQHSPVGALGTGTDPVPSTQISESADIQRNKRVLPCVKTLHAEIPLLCVNGQERPSC